MTRCCTARRVNLALARNVSFGTLTGGAGEGGEIARAMCEMSVTRRCRRNPVPLGEVSRLSRAHDMMLSSEDGGIPIGPLSKECLLQGVPRCSYAMIV